MKKFYIQPETDLMLAAPQSIVCTSPGFGDEKKSNFEGDAPKRKLSVLYI